MQIRCIGRIENSDKTVTDIALTVIRQGYTNLNEEGFVVVQMPTDLKNLERIQNFLDMAKAAKSIGAQTLNIDAIIKFFEEKK